MDDETPGLIDTMRKVTTEKEGVNPPFDLREHQTSNAKYFRLCSPCDGPRNSLGPPLLLEEGAEARVKFIASTLPAARFHKLN